MFRFCYPLPHGTELQAKEGALECSKMPSRTLVRSLAALGDDDCG